MFDTQSDKGLEQLNTFKSQWKKSANEDVDDVTAQEKYRWAYQQALKASRDNNLDVNGTLEHLKENNPSLYQVVRGTNLKDELAKTRRADMDLYNIRKKQNKVPSASVPTTHATDQGTVTPDAPSVPAVPVSKPQQQTTKVPLPKQPVASPTAEDVLVPISTIQTPMMQKLNEDLKKGKSLTQLERRLIAQEKNNMQMNPKDADAYVKRITDEVTGLDNKLSKYSGGKYVTDDDINKSIERGASVIPSVQIREAHIGRAEKQRQELTKAAESLDKQYAEQREVINGSKIPQSQKDKAFQELDGKYNSVKTELQQKLAMYDEPEYKAERAVVLGKQRLDKINVADVVGDNLVIGDTKKARQEFEQANFNTVMELIKVAQQQGKLTDVDAQQIYDRLGQGASIYDNIVDLFTDSDAEKFEKVYKDYVAQANQKHHAIQVADDTKATRGDKVSLKELGWDPSQEGAKGAFRDVRTSGLRTAGRILGEGTGRKYIQGLLETASLPLVLTSKDGFSGYSERVKQYFTGEGNISRGSDEIVQALSPEVSQEGQKKLEGTDSFFKSTAMMATDLAFDLTIGRLAIGGKLATGTIQGAKALRNTKPFSRAMEVVFKHKMPSPQTILQAEDKINKLAQSVATTGVSSGERRASGLRNLFAAIKEDKAGANYLRIVEGLNPKGAEIERTVHMALTFGFGDVLRQFGEGISPEDLGKSLAKGIMFGAVNEASMKYFEKIASNYAKAHSVFNQAAGLQPIGHNVEYFAKLNQAARALSNPFGNVAQSYFGAMMDGTDYSGRQALQDLILGSFFGIRDIQQYVKNDQGKQYREAVQQRLNRVLAGDMDPVEAMREAGLIGEDLAKNEATEKKTVPVTAKPIEQPEPAIDHDSDAEGAIDENYIRNEQKPTAQEIEKKVEEDMAQEEAAKAVTPQEQQPPQEAVPGLRETVTEVPKEPVIEPPAEEVAPPPKMTVRRILNNDAPTVADLANIADLDDTSKGVLNAIGTMMGDVKTEYVNDARMPFIGFDPESKTIILNEAYSFDEGTMRTQLTKRIGEELLHAYDAMLMEQVGPKGKPTREARARIKELEILRTSFLSGLNNQQFDRSRTGTYYNDYLKRNDIEDSDAAFTDFQSEIEYYSGSGGGADLTEFSGAMFNSASAIYDMAKDAVNVNQSNPLAVLTKALSKQLGVDDNVMNAAVEAMTKRVEKQQVPQEPTVSPTLEQAPPSVPISEIQGTASFVAARLANIDKVNQMPKIRNQDMFQLEKLNRLLMYAYPEPEKKLEQVIDDLSLGEDYAALTFPQKITAAYNKVFNEIDQRLIEADKEGRIDPFLYDVMKIRNQELGETNDLPFYTLARLALNDDTLIHKINSNDYISFEEDLVQAAEEYASENNITFDEEAIKLQSRKLWKNRHDLTPTVALNYDISLDGNGNIEKMTLQKEVKPQRTFKSLVRVAERMFDPSSQMMNKKSFALSKEESQSPMQKMIESGNLLRPITIDTTEETVNKISDRNISQASDYLFQNEGIYVIPKGVTGVVGFDVRPLVQPVFDAIEKGEYNKAVDILEQQENWNLWRILDSDLTWGIGNRPDKIDALSTYFDMTKIRRAAENKMKGNYKPIDNLADYLYDHLQKPNEKDVNIRATFDNMKEAKVAEVLEKLNAFVDKLADEVLIDPDGTKHFSKWKELKDYMHYDEDDYAGNSGITKEEIEYLQKLKVDNIYQEAKASAARFIHWMVDPAGAQYLQNPTTKKLPKFGEKYWGVISQVKAYSIFNRVSDVIATAGEKYNEWQPMDWENAGVTFNEQGDMQHKVLIVDADVLKDMMGENVNVDYLIKTLSKDNADGSSFYTNDLLRQLESDMLQADGPSSSVKPAYVNFKNGAMKVIKTMTHDNFLIDNPQSPQEVLLKEFAEGLRLKGIGKVILESGTKLKGNYRYQNDGNYVWDSSNRLVGVKKGDKIDTQGIDELYKQHTLNAILNGQIEPYMIETIPMTGKDGYSLLTATGKREVNTRQFSVLELIHMLDDKFAQSLMPMAHLAKTRIEQYRVQTEALNQMIKGDYENISKAGYKSFVKRLAKHFQTLTSNVDNSIRDYQHSNIVRDLYSAIEDGVVNPARLKAVMAVYGDHINPVIQTIIQRDAKEAKGLPVNSLGMKVQPWTGSSADIDRIAELDKLQIDDYYNNLGENSVEYLTRKRFDIYPKDIESMRGLLKANANIEHDNWIESMNGTYVDEKGDIIDHSIAGTDTPQPIIIGTDDYKEIKDYLDREFGKNYFPGLQGLKVFFNSSPKDSPESFMPMVIVGVGNHKTGLRAHGSAMTDFTGTDFDGDDRGLVLPERDWGEDKRSANKNFTDLHNNFVSLGIQKGATKLKEKAVMKKSNDATGEFNRQFKLADGSYPSIKKTSNNPLSSDYDYNALDATTGMGAGVSKIDKNVAFMRVARLNKGPAKLDYIDYENGKLHQFVFELSPTFQENYQVLKQLGVVDKTTPSTIDYRDLMYGTFIKSYDGVAWSKLHEMTKDEAIQNYNKLANQKVKKSSLFKSKIQRLTPDIEDIPFIIPKNNVDIIADFTKEQKASITSSTTGIRDLAQNAYDYSRGENTKYQFSSFRRMFVKDNNTFNRKNNAIAMKAELIFLANHANPKEGTVLGKNNSGKLFFERSPRGVMMLSFSPESSKAGKAFSVPWKAVINKDGTFTDAFLEKANENITDDFLQDAIYPNERDALTKAFFEEKTDTFKEINRDAKYGLILQKDEIYLDMYPTISERVPTLAQVIAMTAKEKETATKSADMLAGEMILDRLIKAKQANIPVAVAEELRGYGLTPLVPTGELFTDYMLRKNEELWVESVREKITKNNLLPPHPDAIKVVPNNAVDKKAIDKAAISNKFIGFGDDANPKSSTAAYARQYGNRANNTSFSPKDVVFVSVPGKRAFFNDPTSLRRTEAIQKTVDLALKAYDQGATIVADNNLTDYNIGEQTLYDALIAKGAYPIKTDNYAYYSKGNTAKATAGHVKKIQGTFLNRGVAKDLNPANVLRGYEAREGKAVNWSDPDIVSSVITQLHKDLEQKVPKELWGSVARLFDTGRGDTDLTKNWELSRLDEIKNDTEKMKQVAAYLVQAKSAIDAIQKSRERKKGGWKKYLQDVQNNFMILRKDVDDVINNTSANVVSYNGEDTIGSLTSMQYVNGEIVSTTRNIKLRETLDTVTDTRTYAAGLSSHMVNYVMPHRHIHSKFNIVDSLISKSKENIGAFDNEMAREGIAIIDKFNREGLIPLMDFTPIQGGFDGTSIPSILVDLTTGDGGKHMFTTSDTGLTDNIKKYVDAQIYHADEAINEKIRAGMKMLIATKLSDLSIASVNYAIASDLRQWHETKGKTRDGKPRRIEVSKWIEQTIGDLYKNHAEITMDKGLGTALKALSTVKNKEGTSNEAVAAVYMNDWIATASDEDLYNLGIKMYGLTPTENADEISKGANSVSTRLNMLVEQYASKDTIDQHYNYSGGEQKESMVNYQGSNEAVDLMYAMGYGEQMVGYGTDAWERNNLKAHERNHVGVDNSFLHMYLIEPDSDEIAHDNIALQLQSAQSRGVLVNRKVKLGDFRREALSKFDAGDRIHFPENTGKITQVQYVGRDGALRSKQGLMMGIVDRDVVNNKKEVIGTVPTVVMMNPDHESISFIGLSNISTMHEGTYTTTSQGLEMSRRENLQKYVKSNAERILAEALNMPLKIRYDKDGNWTIRNDSQLHDDLEDVIKANKGSKLRRAIDYGWNVGTFMGRAGYIGLRAIPVAGLTIATGIATGSVVPIAFGALGLVEKPIRNSLANIISSVRNNVIRHGLGAISVGADEKGEVKLAGLTDLTQKQRVRQGNTFFTPLGRGAEGVINEYEGKKSINAPFKNWWDNTIANPKSLPSVHKKIASDPELAAIREQAFYDITGENINKIEESDPRAKVVDITQHLRGDVAKAVKEKGYQAYVVTDRKGKQRLEMYDKNGIKASVVETQRIKLLEALSYYTQLYGLQMNTEISGLKRSTINAAKLLNYESPALLNNENDKVLVQDMLNKILDRTNGKYIRTANELSPMGSYFTLFSHFNRQMAHYTMYDVPKRLEMYNTLLDLLGQDAKGFAKVKRLFKEYDLDIEGLRTINPAKMVSRQMMYGMAQLATKATTYGLTTYFLDELLEDEEDSEWLKEGMKWLKTKQDEMDTANQLLGINNLYYKGMSAMVSLGLIAGDMLDVIDADEMGETTQQQLSVNKGIGMGLKEGGRIAGGGYGVSQFVDAAVFGTMLSYNYLNEDEHSAKFQAGIDEQQTKEFVYLLDIAVPFTGFAAPAIATAQLGAETYYKTKPKEKK